MENRKLAAIMATDLVGYSRLAGEDEERTLIRLRSLRSEFLDPTIAVNNGRVVKRIGDGLLVEFRSVVDATRCAVELQRGLADRNSAVAPQRQFHFRIGIHLGDVVEEPDGDLMGDGVNIAARLESIAKPGAICISEDAYRQVRNRLSLSIDDLGPKGLKNIAEPVRVFSIGVEGEALAKPRRRPPARSAIWIAGSVVAALLAAGALVALRPALPPVTAAHVAPAPPAPSPLAQAAKATLAAADAARDAKDYPRALALYSELADAGDAQAVSQLGRLYRDGLGAPFDPKRAAELFRKAAEQGEPWAQANLGDLYWRGEGLERDYTQSLRWFQKAAAQNNPLGQNGLGILYENGWGVPRDEAESRKWFQMAADQDFAWGYANLADIYRRGLGVAPDYEKARRYAQLAADRGNPGGQNTMGLLYLYGQGVERDPEQAFAWFKKSAAQNYDWGEVNLAVILRESPTHRDFAEALRLAADAVAKGNSAGMNTLGLIYEWGQGVAPDPSQAFELYSKSANLGFRWGMLNLGYAYARAVGVSRDCALAKQWLAKAVVGGKDVRDYYVAHPVCGFDPAPP